MNHKVALFLLLTVSILISFLRVEAQQPKNVPRIGYLSSGDSGTESDRSEAIRLALRERGFIEGQNIAVEYRYAERKVDRGPELASELVRVKVDIILVPARPTRI